MDALGKKAAIGRSLFTLPQFKYYTTHSPWRTPIARARVESLGSDVL